MITTSTEFGELAVNGAKWHTKIIGIQDEVSNINYSNIVNPYDVFTIGNTASAMLSFDIVEPTQNIENLEMQAQQGIETSKGMEYITLGHFKVLKAVLDGNKLTCQAVDKMTYLMSDKYIPNVTLPTTDIAILDDIASQVGVTVVKDNLVSHKITYLTNAYSKKEIIGYIAALQGKNAYFDTQGRLAFKFYDSIDYTIDDDRIYYDTPTNINSESDFTCQYINCTVYANGTVTELTSGNGEMGISITNPFMTQAILDEVLSKVKNITFRPMEIEFLGDFRLEIGDIVTVNTNGIDYTVPIMQINHMSDGGVITNITSIAQTEAENSVEVEGELSQKLNKMLFDLVETREITDGNTTKIVEQGTQIEAVQGSITSKVWQEDIELAKVSNSVSSQSPIVVNDSANGNYIGMKIYGKSTQNGTPTPQNPIEIESVGIYDEASQKHKIVIESTPNLVTYFEQGGVSSDNGQNTDSTTLWRTNYIGAKPNSLLYVYGYDISTTRNARVFFYDKDKKYISTLLGTNHFNFTVPNNCYYIRLHLDQSVTNFRNMVVSYLPQEEYKVTQATFKIQNGLNSIGDVKDEIDLNRGVLIQKIAKVIFDGSSDESWGMETSANGAINFYMNVGTPERADILCSHFASDNTLSNTVRNCYATKNYINFYPYDNTLTSTANWRNWLSVNNMTVCYQLGTPIEIPLSEEELAQYRALLTYNPTTVINVTDNAEVDAEYYRNSEDGQTLANGNSSSSSQIQQLANKISLVVKSGDSETELELTPEMAKVVAQIISLNGDVKVNGNQIVDGSITANKINTNGLTVKNSGVDANNNTVSVEIVDGKIVLTGTWGTTTITSQGIYSSNFNISSEGKAKFESVDVDEYINVNDIQAESGDITDLTVKDSLNVNNSPYGITGNMLEIIGTTDFITTNLVPADEQIARISSGGYYQVGKRVFVQMTLSPTANLASNNYHELFTGFPKPLTGCAALSACLMDEPARLDAYIDRGNTTLVLNTSATLTQGLTIGITGSYICE